MDCTTPPSSPADQRIKVTLTSAPRNSTDHSQALEPLFIEDPTARAPLLSSTSRQQQRRQSTATLISACGPTTAEIETEKPTSSGDQAQATATTSGLTRAQQENELRRIASQRLKRANSPLVLGQSRSKSASPDPPKPVASHEGPATAVASPRPLLSPPAPPVKLGGGLQLQQQQPPEANPKQLAIYINGKIRSNSIFCRSTSSSSFNGLLNKFQGGPSSRNDKQPAGHSTNERAAGQLQCDKQSPLRLCRRRRQASSSGATSKRSPTGRGPLASKQRSATSGASLKGSYPAGGRLLGAASLRHNLGRLLTSYLVGGGRLAARSSTTSASDHRPVPEQQGAVDGEGSLKRLKKASRSFSTTGSQHQEAGNKGQEEEEEEVGDYAESADLEEGGETQQSSYKLNPSSMFLRKAMRYYRLWIYCTNITIFLGTLIFILSAIYVMSDYRIKLLVGPSAPHQQQPHLSLTTLSLNSPHSSSDQLNQPEPLQQQRSLPDQRRHQSANQTPLTNNTAQNHHHQSTLRPNYHHREHLDEYNISISYTEPYVILAYLAIALQAGLLQAVGCFGAVRMKERWIQAFYYLILALIALDVMLLMGWLNRYDFIVKSLHEHMTLRLRQHYGAPPLGASPVRANDSVLGPRHHELEPNLQDNINNLFSGSANTQEQLESKLDRVFTEIIDKIQSNSQCCGISSSLDYRHSKWRRRKVEQLRGQLLNWTAISGVGAEAASGSFLEQLMSRVPLVPASCCRQQPAAGRDPVIPARPPPDDSQLERPNRRIPAWSPSMVVENLDLRQRGPKQAAKHQSVTDYALELDDAEEATNGATQSNELASAGGEEEEEQEASSSWLGRVERRLQAKEGNFRRGPSDNSNGRERRWTVESTVDSEQRVLMRLIETQMEEDPTSGDNSIDASGALLSNNNNREQLAKLRRILFQQTAHTRPQNQSSWCAATGGDTCFTSDHFRWPNKLRLSFDQYKIIENYLLKDIGDDDQDLSDRMGAHRPTPPAGPRVRRHASARSAIRPGEEERRQNCSRTKSCSQPLVRREKSVDFNEGGEDAPTRRGSNQGGKSGSERAQQSANYSKEELALLKQLAETIKADQELTCAPRNYYDLRSIHARGCYPDIKAWLDSSAHILFVTGFCILTVLKFCSLVLLRLEIREMIHKIRVLKGMATEYNALQDLEAYLPRPSFCGPAAAELTPGGVALAAAAAASPVPPVCPASGAGSASVSPRLGGSFSEAVVAATAAAHSQSGATALGLGGLAQSGRAASMKAVAAMSNMLTPSLCPRSSSVSAAQLQAAASLLSGASAGHTLHSDPFQVNGGMMSRRHTAISVCPAAAAAAVAAQHLMSRRGTYVANPMFEPPAVNLMSSGSSLFQHRHSAHTVHTLLARPHSQQQQQQIGPTSGSGASRRQSRHHLGDTPTGPTFEHQSSGESATATTAANQLRAATSGATVAGPEGQMRAGGSHQLLSLVYPFKRQSSAGNFSLDLAPSLPTGSRRSIY